MKKSVLYFMLFILAHFTNLFAQGSQFKDPRDGKIYKTVKIGNQTWFAENLKFNTANGKSYIYNNENGNLITYGYLYDWATACNVCPSGWKLPSNEEWLVLSGYLGDAFKQRLMSKSIWNASEMITNETGFNGLPGGLRDHVGTFRNLGIGAYFWSLSPQDQNFAFARELGKSAGNYASHQFGTNKIMALSVRCLMIEQEEEENDFSEYEEEPYEEPITEQYEETHPIEKSLKNYVVSKTQTCNEKQDLYYNYMEEYECKPVKSANIKITIDIHLSDPMYDEALVTIYDNLKKTNDKFPIEYVEKLDDGTLLFHFTVINQPHTFLLDEKNKRISWDSEWGHWRELHFFN